jgi:hypothetical protein
MPSQPVYEIGPGAAAALAAALEELQDNPVWVKFYVEAPFLGLLQALRTGQEVRLLGTSPAPVDRPAGAARPAPTEGAFASLGDPGARAVTGEASPQSVREAPTPPLFRR